MTKLPVFIDLKDLEIAELKEKLKQYELERKELMKAVSDLSLYLQVESM